MTWKHGNQSKPNVIAVSSVILQLRLKWVMIFAYIYVMDYKNTYITLVYYINNNKI